MKPLSTILSAMVLAAASTASAQPALTALPTLDIPAYMGTWYQVAWYPNRFQKQCVADTTATYRRIPEGVEVTNRCRNAEGRIESIVGLARPAGAEIRGDALQPAQLEVSFLPSWLRWLPIWGSYWVIHLWVLSRAPALAPADETAIRSRLVQQGFELTRWQTHPHTPAAEAPR